MRIVSTVRYRVGGAVRGTGRMLAATFSARDCLLFAGLALLAAGLAMVYPPAAFMLPGAVLVLVAILGVR